MFYKNILIISLFQLISGASISQIKQADRSLLHPEFLPVSQNSTKTNEYYDYYDYDEYYEDYETPKNSEAYEYYEEDQDELKIKPLPNNQVSATKTIQSVNKTSEIFDYDDYEDNGDEDYYQLSNSRRLMTTTTQSTTKSQTKSSMSILNFLFINTTSKPFEIVHPLPEITNGPDLPSNISDNFVQKSLFTDSYDLYENSDESEDEFKKQENKIIDKINSTVSATIKPEKTSNLFWEEEYGNYTDMYYYDDDIYDLDESYDDLLSSNDEYKEFKKELSSTSTTNQMPNINIINVIATVSYNTTHIPTTTTQLVVTSSKTMPSVTHNPTIFKPTISKSTPSLEDKFPVDATNFFTKQDYEYYENYFEDLQEEIEDDLEVNKIKETEIKTPLNSTLISLTIKELLKSPALIAGICGGLLVGVITAAVLLFFIIHRMKRNKLDDSNYVVSSKNSPIYGNFKTNGQNITLMSSSSVSPNTNLSTGSTSSATTGLLNGHTMASSRLLKYTNHSTSLKKSCSILSSDSSSSSPNHDGSFNYAYIKAPTKEFYA